MNRVVYWSEEAENSLIQLVAYLEMEWSQQSADKFLNILDEKINLLLDYPEMCEHSFSKKQIRKCVITKQVSILYNFTKHEINIFSIVDNRSNNERKINH